jgi:ssDNA-binding Zn-finger/Zn-ribbon topoisomerase 1
MLQEYASATMVAYLTPSCPICGIKLVKLERKKDKSPYWGCANYPRCRITLSV